MVGRLGIKLATRAFLCVVCLAASAQRLIVRIEPEAIVLGNDALMSVRLEDARGRAFARPRITAPNMIVQTLPPDSGRMTDGNMQWRYVIAPINATRSTVVAALTVDGIRQTAEKTVEVVLGRSSSGPAVPFAADWMVEDLTGRRFVRASVDKTEAFVHEQITYSFRYYFENWLPTREPSQYGLPAFAGFYTREIDKSGGDENAKATIDGREYFVERVRIALFPLTAGEWEIPETRLVLPPHAGKPSRELRTDALSVTARPLPNPSPDGFTGGIGEFAVNSQWIGPSIGTVGQAARFDVTLTGRGSLQTLTDMPKPSATDGTVYEPRVEDRVDIVNGQVGGTRTLTYVYAPDRAGVHRITIPAMTTFSPTKGEYVTSGPFAHILTVSAASAEKTDKAQAPSGVSSAFGRASRFAFPLIGAAALLWIAVGMARRFRVRAGRRTAIQRSDGALAEALSNLRALNPDSAAFCKELGARIRACVAAKYALEQPVGEANVTARLRSDGSVAATGLLGILDECAEGEFAPVSLSQSERRELLRRAQATTDAFVEAS